MDSSVVALVNMMRRQSMSYVCPHNTWTTGPRMRSPHMVQSRGLRVYKHLEHFELVYGTWTYTGRLAESKSSAMNSEVPLEEAMEDASESLYHS